MKLFKQRMQAFGILLMLLTHVSVAGSKAPINVTHQELDRYWVVAQDLMPPAMPPLVQSSFALVQKHGRIVLDYEVTINEKGVPVDFKFKSITPANLDPKPFIASVMWIRYRPAAQNSAHQAVRLRGPLPFFTPKN